MGRFGAIAGGIGQPARAPARACKPRRDWRRRFLDGFKRTGTVTGGCAYAGIHRSSAYRERQRSEKFALAWSDIEDEVTDRLEATTLLSG